MEAEIHINYSNRFGMDPRLRGDDECKTYQSYFQVWALSVLGAYKLQFLFNTEATESYFLIPTILWIVESETL